MSAALNISLKQMKKLVSSFSSAEQEELARYLDQLTLGQRLNKFISENSSIPFSYEEITREVEKVRTDRYK
ncbi:MAG: hypothetical protein PHW04_11560 [Candidatus Wallbacteria bacterium]|nr:hypothetical protein [Candidatus Wallbacteria bacterium]